MADYILNANDLLSGRVVYWTGTSWSFSIADARLVENTPATLAIGEAAVAARRVIDPYVIEVALKEGQYWPVLKREQVRAQGPSVRQDLTKEDLSSLQDA